MRIGDFVGSGIGMIICAGIFLYTQSGVAECSTSLGQIGQFLSSNLTRECQIIGMFNFISALAFLSFLILLIYHAAAKPKS